MCDVRIVLTGAGGFIGRHLAPIMTAAGDDVFALVPPGRALGEIPVRRVIEVDLSDAPTLRRELASVRPELCVHLAWRGWSGPHKRPVVNVESLAASANTCYLDLKDTTATTADIALAATNNSTGFEARRNSARNVWHRSKLRLCIIAVDPKRLGI